MTKYEEQYYHDVHRIADALEHISKWITQMDLSRQVQNEGMIELCKFLKEETARGAKFVIDGMEIK